MTNPPDGTVRTSRWLAASALLLAGATASAAESGDGKLAFNTQCRTCHSTDEGDNRLGPNLHAIVGKKAGEAEGFANYSQALITSGITWDEKTLDQFIANPNKVVPGNNMKPYQGIGDAATRKAIVDFLKTGSK